MKLNGKQIEAALVDMDGTIFATESLYSKAFHQAASNLKLPLAPDWYDNHGAGVRYDEMMKAARETWADISDEKMKEFIAEVNRLTVKYLKKGAPVKEGVMKTLAFFKENNIPLALVSSTILPQIAFFLRKAGLKGFFDTLVSGEMVKKPKPEPMCYQIAMERLKVKPENCLVFEDSVAGILSGKGSGATVIHVPDYQKIPAEVLEKADVVLRRMDEVINLFDCF